MPIDPYLALNAMLRAEAARFSPSAPQATQPGQAGQLRRSESETAATSEAPGPDTAAE
ncbi:hypothetical protein [Streptomyces sp. NBC_00503]|uniref:hypothetical protein n=1 Tax=Streptomyces sp. NBC_00503 TaxID=2903659 RepID=UPI002E811D32|nr:hypothetical protein [Streptomyces sp. NBC_00503]WUD82510.1 hypothetical protein OG490_19290 [Streptomyces sp. NBC_00503]